MDLKRRAAIIAYYDDMINRIDMHAEELLTQHGDAATLTQDDASTKEIRATRMLLVEEIQRVQRLSLDANSNGQQQTAFCYWIDNLQLFGRHQASITAKIRFGFEISALENKFAPHLYRLGVLISSDCMPPIDELDKTLNEIKNFDLVSTLMRNKPTDSETKSFTCHIYMNELNKLIAKGCDQSATPNEPNDPILRLQFASQQELLLKDTSLINYLHVKPNAVKAISLNAIDLAPFRSLRRLTLVHIDVNSLSRDSFSSLQRLESLDVFLLNQTDNDRLGFLAGLPSDHLTELTLSVYTRSVIEAHVFAHFHKLERLELNYVFPDDMLPLPQPEAKPVHPNPIENEADNVNVIADREPVGGIREQPNLETENEAADMANRADHQPVHDIRLNDAQARSDRRKQQFLDIGMELSRQQRALTSRALTPLFDDDSLNLREIHINIMYDIDKATLFSSEIHRPLGLPGSLGALTHLSLRRTELTEIDAQTFAPLVHLLKLDLSSNRCLKRIADNAFAHMTQLVELTLACNLNIAPFTVNTLSGLVALRQLRMPNFLLRDFELKRAYFRAMPELSELAVDNYIDLNSAVDEHEPAAGRGAFAYHPLRILSISSHTKRSLATETFVNYPSLVKLELGNCTTSLQDAAFRGLSNLVELTLYDCDLEHWNERAVIGLSGERFLPSLRTLSLLKCDRLVFKTNMFVGLESLTRLVVKSKQTGTSAANMFAGLVNLEALEWNFGKFKLVPNTFLGLSNLRKLDLSSNNLEHLTAGIFNTGLSSLQNLVLTNSGIERIEDDAFVGLANLRRLDISQNKWRTLTQNTFRGLDHLQELKIGSIKGGKLINPTVVHCETFLCLPCLKKVDYPIAPMFLENLAKHPNMKYLIKFLSTVNELEKQQKNSLIDIF